MWWIDLEDVNKFHFKHGERVAFGTFKVSCLVGVLQWFWRTARGRRTQIFESLRCADVTDSIKVGKTDQEKWAKTLEIFPMNTYSLRDWFIHLVSWSLLSACCEPGVLFGTKDITYMTVKCSVLVELTSRWDWWEWDVEYGQGEGNRTSGSVHSHIWTQDKFKWLVS